MFIYRQAQCFVHTTDGNVKLVNVKLSLCLTKLHAMKPYN